MRICACVGAQTEVGGGKMCMRVHAGECCVRVLSCVYEVQRWYGSLAVLL
jgi:hypothetical protein